MQFAVDVLQVRHIFVVGHYGCAGVGAALMGRRLGLVDNWLRHIQDVRLKHANDWSRRQKPSGRTGCVNSTSWNR
jgi:carbonic anhydrase